jgi:hypothetical protein
MELNFARACPNPVALLILPWPRKGATVAHRDADGTLYGCRDVSYGTHFETILKAWIRGAEKQGLDVEITAPRARHLGRI